MSIFGIGTVVVDHAVLLDKFPECDTKNSVRRSWKQIGGPVPVALSTAAFYGNACGFLGRWGTDDAGAFIEHGLRKRGIHLDASKSDPTWSTGFAHVWVTPDGKRTIAYSRGEFPLPTETEVANTSLGNDHILHLDGWASDAALAASRVIRDSGGTVVLDAGSMKPGVERLFPLVDILVASELFRRNCFGKADVGDDELRSLKCDSVLTTHGPDGARWLTDEGAFGHAGFSVDAVDTNGAGDIFCGALLHALIHKYDKLQTLEFANAVAALSCTHHGNETLPTLADVRSFV